MNTWDEIRAEFRQSLPEIMAGRDPLRFKVRRCCNAGRPATSPRARKKLLSFDALKQAIFWELTCAAATHSRVPSLAEITQTVHAHKSRVTAAFNDLEREGLIEAWGCRGAGATKHGVIICATGERTT